MVVDYIDKGSPLPRVVNITSASSILWASIASHQILKAVSETLDKKPFCNIMLTGGNSAKRLYEEMALSLALPINRMRFFWGDERCVPISSLDSNFGLAKRCIFDKYNDHPNYVARIEGELPDHIDAARRYSLLLNENMDILILGVGVDGHVASLFPWQSALNEVELSAVAISPAGIRGPRITITPRVIDTSKNVFLLAPGAKKGAILAQSLVIPTNYAAYPARLALRGRWLLDDEAVKEFLSQWRRIKKIAPYTCINLNGVML